MSQKIVANVKTELNCFFLCIRHCEQVEVMHFKSESSVGEPNIDLKISVQNLLV